MRRRAAKTLMRKEWRVLARSTPPQKPVYPKNEPQPRRQAPQRPVYTYDADVPRQPRKPAGGRVVYDYNKSAGASSGVPAGSPARPAAPFVTTAPQAPQQGRGTAPAAGNNAGIPEPRQPRGTGRGTTAPAAGRAPYASAGRAALARSAGTGGGAEAAPGRVRPERGQAPPTPRKQRFARPGPHAGRAAAGEKRKGPEKAEEKASAPPPHTGRSAPPPRPARHSGGRADRRAAGGRVPDLGGRAV